MAEALNNLGNALRLTGDIDGALHAYQEALTQRAVYPGGLQQSRHSASAGPQARGSRACASQGNPAEPALHRGLQQSRAAPVAQKQEVEALRILAEALKFAPKNVQTLLITAKIQLRREQPSGGRAGDPPGAPGGARECRGTDGSWPDPARDRSLRRGTRGPRPRAQEGARKSRSAQLLRRGAEIGWPAGRGARVYPQGAED